MLVLRLFAVFISILFFPFYGCSGGASGPALMKGSVKCRADADCVLIEGPCGCRAGGRRFAVPKGEFLPNNKKRVFCPQVISRHPTCLEGARAVCSHGRCVISVGGRLYSK